MKNFATPLITAAMMLVCVQANAASTINPSQPAQNAPLNSAPVRQNFQNAYNDINNLSSMFYGATAPISPSNLQRWADSSGYPVIVLKYFNGATATWIAYGQINATSNAYIPYVGSSLLASAPLSVATGAGVTTFSLNYDSNFAISSNNLAFAPAPSGDLIANAGASNAEPVATNYSTWFDRTIGGGAASDGMVPYRSGGTWSNIDATSAATPNTIAARDGSNNIGGHATLDLAIANNLSDLASASTARTNLGLGTAATQNTGTSGATVPLLNGNNTYSGTSNFTGTFEVGGFTMTFPGSAATLLYSGGALGTPSSGTATNLTGLPLSTGVTGTLQAAQEPAHTGDVTNAAGSLAMTLATVNSNTGSFGSATSVPSFTVNGKGLITAASSNAIPSATNAAKGLMEGDGTTINCAAGVCSAILPSAANPSALIGLTGKNGSATTFMRSDAASALDQSISPTWTGNHTFDNTIVENTGLLIGLPSFLTGSVLQYTNFQDAGASGSVGGNGSFLQFSNDASSAFLNFAKSRSTTKTGPGTTVQNNDDIGELDYIASDGTNWVEGGYFTATINSAVSTGVMPMRFEWGSQNASGVMNERMRLGTSLTVGDVINNTYNQIVLNPGASGVSAPLIQFTNASVTDLNATVETQGLGNLSFTSGGFSPELTLLATTNAVNYLTIQGAISGASPTLAATGSDTNVNLALVTKGTGTLIINGTAAVTCSTVSASTMKVTNGIVTHC